VLYTSPLAQEEAPTYPTPLISMRYTVKSGVASSVVSCERETLRAGIRAMVSAGPFTIDLTAILPGAMIGTIGIALHIRVSINSKNTLYFGNSQRSLTGLRGRAFTILQQPTAQPA
jgi:hypothetical protein